MARSPSSYTANLQHIPCKFFKSGACTAGKNCLFSHSRDPPSENFVCKYFLKGNCKFGAKCSLSHSFLALDRKTSALMPGGGGGSLGRNNRLERRASSGAILNNPWAAEPLSPPYMSSLAQQQQALQFNNSHSNNNVEFAMGGRSPNQQGFMKPAMNRAASDGLRSAVYMTPPTEAGNGSGGHRSPFSEDENANTDANGNERVAHPLSLLESRTMGATSPFHQPGNKGLFLSVSSSENETTPSSPLRLHSIPELHDLYNSHGQDNNHGHTSLPRRSSSAHFHSVIPDDDDDENDNDGDEFSDSEDSDQGFLPSSLNDLLTTHERQRRQSRQDDVDPRLNMLPSPASGSLRGDKDEDDTRFGYGALSSVPGVSQQTDFRPHFQSTFSKYDGSSHETSISPLAMLIPNNQMTPFPFQEPSSFETAEDRSYQRQHPHYHQRHQHPHHHQQLRAMSKDQGPHYKERNLTPDPFCPFPSDAEEVQFVMDDDVVTSTAGNSRIHISAGGGGGGQSTIAAQRDHDIRAGLFVDGSARTMTVAGKELNRAVGSQSTMQGGKQQQQPQGTLTPVSVNSREDDTTESSGAAGAVSSIAMDFSALNISNNCNTELFDHSGSTVSPPTSYAGIARSQKSSF
ncbi:hypothetical protein BGZ68_006706 [Mortierella alpina]|nr:hypothetical protein BGZ68_006706 [Mortierella alpina]